MSSEQKFCGDCGEPRASDAVLPEYGRAKSPTPAQYTPPRLVKRILADQAAMEARGLVAGERRTVTALFADLVGSTALMLELDPEDARRVIDPVLSLMMDAVHHYEGYVAKSLGDGILAVFGAPISHEDHPQRALYAALRMQEMMRRQLDDAADAGAALKIRIGINTGEVVVRSLHMDSLHTDYDPIGNSINIASRLESTAAPGATLVSEATYRLTEGYFTFKGPYVCQMKGLSGPMKTFQLMGPGLFKNRFQAAQKRGLSQFVGRQKMLAQLNRGLARLNGAHGQIIGLAGEPGVGKSRLIHEFKQLARPGCTVLETFTVSHGKAFPYLPLIELLRGLFQIALSDTVVAGRIKVHNWLHNLDVELLDTEPYVLQLLGLSNDDRVVAQMDPRLRCQRIFAAITRMLRRLSNQRPLLLVFEDLQWMDTETEDFLNFLSEGISNVPILLLISYRPEYQHRGSVWSEYLELRLTPLGRGDADELLTVLLGRRPELASMRSLILSKAGGNPLFIEELVQALIEQGALQGVRGDLRLICASKVLALPSSIRGILMARMDCLPPSAKTLLQTLAVVGNEFPLSLAQQVTGETEELLRRGLDKLQQGGFIYGRPSFPEIVFSFKHAMTQQVAYDSLLSEQRAMLHERTGQAIETRFDNRLDDHFNELAHHYSHSGNMPQALKYLKCAAQQAQRQSAHREVLEHLKTALQLLPQLSDTVERTKHELELLLAAGPAWLALKGFAAREVEDTYNRALVLSRQVNNRSQLFSALFGLRLCYHGQGQFETACQLSRQLVSLASELHEPALLLEAHLAFGTALFHTGDLQQARIHLERVSQLYDPSHYRTHVVRFGMDPAVTSLATLARVLWYLGYPDQALARMARAITLARSLSSSYEMAFTLVHSAELHLHCRMLSGARKHVEAAIDISAEQGYILWLNRGHILHGSLVALMGQPKKGLVEFNQWLERYRESDEHMWLPFFLGLKVEIYCQLERTSEMMTIIDEALTQTAEKHELICLPELLRLKADLLLKLGELEADRLAERCLQRALKRAHMLQARSLELRTAMSLFRLRTRQGRAEEGRQLLSNIYSLFSEGFETGDLQQARFMLSE